MALFQPAESTSAFLKMGLLGFAGSGKTKTATLTAIGLVQYARERKIDYAGKPVFFIDTETGSDWVKPDFDAAGIPLMVAKTRAFVDLLTAVQEAQKDGSLLLVDSISHFWKELCDSYSRQKAKQFKSATYRLQFPDWGYLKGEWGKFTDAYINSPLHIILAGRAGYEYDYFENDEGKRELEKTGIKMKAEGEMGYEPSLLVLMERNQKIEGSSVVASWREATVLKDRSTKLDGKVFTNPNFASFMEHIECLNLGGRQLGVDTKRTSEHAVVVEKKDWSGTQRAIVLEEIEALLVEHYPSTGKEDKQAKAALILKHFNTRSWTAVCNMNLIELRTRYDELHQELKGVPSRFGSAIEKANKPIEINDELPDHSAPPAQAAEQRPPMLVEKLQRELRDCKSMADCFSWAAAIGTMDGLSVQERLLLSNDLIAQQKAITGAGSEIAPNEKNPSKPATRTPRSGAGKNYVADLTVMDAG